MKKLLLTLFAFATVFVACDKDYESEIQAVELEQVEMTNNDIDIDNLTSRLLRLSENIKQFSPKESSSDRTAGGHILLLSGTSSGIYSEYLLSDDVSFCNADGLDQVYLVLNGTNTEVRLLSPTGFKVADIPGIPSFLYGVTIAEGLKYTISNGNLQVVDGSGVPNFDFTMHGFSDADFRCSTSVDVSSFYTVSPAPFPLSGFLATMISDYATMTGWPGGTSLNYAATSTSTLIQAIEADINNAQ